MLAKISPTSPRGIMPSPISSRSLRVPAAPYADTILPAIAMTSRTAASSSTLGWNIAPTSAFTPMSTKNTGIRTPPMPLRSPAMRSWCSLRPIARPAMNAPMMNASWAESASTASPRTITSATTVSVVPERENRAVSARSRGTRKDADDAGEHEEAEGDPNRRCHDPDRHGVAGDDLDHDREDDQAEHVVGNGRPEHDARLHRRQRPEVAEDSRCDPDAGRGQGGTEEDRGLGVEPEADPSTGARDERDGNADDRHEHRRPPDTTELGEVHLHPDLHEQQQDTELGKHPEADTPLAPQLDEPEHRGADQDASDDLAQYRRNTDPLSPLGGELGCGQHDQQVEQQARQIDGLHQIVRLSPGSR